MAGRRNRLITGNPLSRKIPYKRNPLYHKHVYLIVSRRTLKHTMQKFESIKNHRENQRNQNNQGGQGNNYQTPSRKPNKQTFRPMSAVLVSLGFPIVFDIFKCTLDSSKRLGRGCAPLLNKAFTLHEFPYIRGFLV